ncbi:MAG: ribonuclease HII [Tannerellaceae bacterium]|jgi:ribonuclease HII|nr:ribonuclease HII [Tannerellaceae bacterium]
MLLPYLETGRVEAGCDEAGRGCLAGAVFAAAVILPQDFRHEWMNDSKQLTEKQRYRLRPIIEREALAWAIGIATPEEIDERNILNASFLAMHRAVDRLSLIPAHLLIDGNRFRPYPGISHTTIVKGDAKYLSIAAASILAKTYRDDYMLGLDKEYPAYGWKENKGYPTPAHRRAILSHGITAYHRQTFTLLPKGKFTDSAAGESCGRLIPAQEYHDVIS